ncbi:MAG: DinB family protein [Bacteroidetes bacterium]|nr:MAG: DinB family protein [Bacteroidota bacterium]
MITQTPWTERKFEFNLPVGVFPVIVERLRGAPIRLQAMLRDVTNETLNQRPGDKWSVLEQVNHLCNCEEIWLGRVNDILARKEVFERRTLNAELQSEDIEVLLRNFSVVRSKLIALVENMDEPTASLTINHPRLQKPIRLMDALFSTAEHDDHHLAKIRELLR